MEIPRKFYREHMNDLVRFTNAEQENEIVFFTFMRGQRQITMQFKRDEFKSLDVLSICQDIQNHFKAVNWWDEDKNWCYLSRSRKYKHLVFTQRHKAVDRLKIKEQPWARMVHENDIIIDEYGPLYRYGKWKDREVDVYKVWTDRDLPFLDHAMKAYRRLQGMNLTYDILGHVIDDDENIVGIMTEPMVGRPLEFQDANLVFDSLRRLIDIGWILDYPQPGSMFVTDKGELRITAMHNVVELPSNAEQRSKKISDVERFCREHVFTRLKSPNERFDKFDAFDGSITRKRLCIPVQILVPLGDPEKVLKGSIDWVVEPFKWRYPVEILKMSRSQGVKRLLEADESNDSRSGYGDRSKVTKKNRNPFYNRQKRPHRSSGIERYETPPPYLSIYGGNLSLMPPEEFQDFPPRSSSMFSPRTDSLPSWMHDGDWLQLAATPARFEIVDPETTS